MEFIKLSKRLLTIANFVPEGANVADIGTDHGYIPVWLAQHNLANNIAAADINRGPLDHAIATAHEYDVYEKINFHLCSGLNFSDSNKYNTVIIAGMGGELIASIIEEAPWTKEGVTLILQPNSKIQDLIEWLIENGYAIQNGKLAKDAGKYYQVLVVTAGDSSPIEVEANRLVHNQYFKNKDPLLHDYLNHLLIKFGNARRGMLSSKSNSPDLQRIDDLIYALQNMKKEVERW